MPPPDLGGEGGVPSSVGSDPAATESSSAADIPSLIERALAKLPPELREQAVDTKRKAKSKDPGWKYGWWPDPTKKDFVQCIFCKKVVPSGICRFKQHLAGGRGDAMGCPNPPEIVKREMNDYLKKNSRTVLVEVPAAAGGEDEEEQEQDAAAEPVKIPSSGTKLKQAKRKIAQAAITSFIVSAAAKPETQKQSRSVSSLLCKSPEQVVTERHKSKQSQPTLEHCTKKGKEAKLIVDDHVGDFLYENRIPLNVINCTN
jgi:hypothetical protein